MSTLADINQALQNQTSVLEDVASSTASTNSNLDRFIRAMQRKQDGDDLEAEREKGRARLFQSRQQKTSDRPESTKREFFGDFQAKDLLTPGLLLSGFAPKVAKTALKAVPAALALAFAEDINKWVDSATGSKDLADAAERAAIGGTFGALISKRFGLIGLAVGALATEENKAAASDLGQALIDKAGDAKTAIQEWANSESAKNLAEKFGTTGEKIREYATNLPTASEILVGLQTKVGEGLTGLTGFINGGFDDEDFQKNWEQGVGLLGGVILVLKPLRKMVFGLAKFAMRTRIGRLITAVGLGTAAVNEIFDGDDEFSESDLTAAIGLTLGAGAAAVAATRKLRASPGRGGAGGNTAATGSAIGAPMTKSGRVLGEVFETKSGGRMKVMQNPKGGLYTQAVPKDTPLGKPAAKWWSKFPRARGLMGGGGFAGLAGAAGAGALFALIDGLAIASIMNDESLTEQQKIERAGYVLAGSIGALGGLGVGTLVGGPLGGFIGSVAGSFLGDTSFGQSLGEGLMEWIMGGNNEAPAGLRGDRRRRRNGSYDISPSSFDESFTPAPVSRPKVSSGVAEGTYVMTAQQEAMSYRSANGNTNIGQVGNNTTNNVSNSQPIMLNNGVVFDPNDMVLQ